MKKQVWALLLIAALLTGLLAGCGNGENETDDGQGQETPAAGGLAYQASYYPLEIGEAYPISYMNYVCLSGQNLYFTADYTTGEMVEEFDPYFGESYSYEASVTGLFRIDLTTHEVTKLDGYQPFEVPEGMQGYSYISNMSAGENGTVWICESCSTYFYDLPEDFNAETDDAGMYYTPGENITKMSQYDADGNLLRSADIQAGEGIYLWGYYADTRGYIYATDGESVYLYDGDGALLCTLPNEGYGELVRYSDAQIGLRTWTEEGGMVFRLIDPETQSLGEEIPLSVNAYDLRPGNDTYQYLYNYNGVFYGHNEKTGENEKLFSFMDCDVNISDLSFSSILEDGTVIALEEDNSGETAKFSLILAEQVDASTLPQKQELTLACMYLSYDLRSQIISFNRASSDTRIVVADYSEYDSEDDWTAGLTKLNTEILSGAAPDILLVNSSMPLQQYAAKGILTDLWQLIDSDPELSREDLMTHFFDALSIDGKLYQVVDMFSIQTAVGLTSVVGDRSSWTLDELLETLATLEPDATIFGAWDTKAGILENCVSRSIDNFVDWSNPSAPCSFDSQEFIDMLEFANSFPAEFSYEDYDWDSYESEYARMRKGQQLLSTAYIYGIESVRYTKANFGGESVSYIGYPSSNGTGSFFSVGNGLAISSSCKDVDAAWSFVRTILTEEHQTTDYIWNFPTNRHSFEAMVEQAMTPEYTTDPETGEQVEVTTSWWVDDDTTIEIGAMSQEEYDELMKLYESCSTVYSYNESIMNIINEEVEAYFDGQKTVEETARLIQDRVGLYVMEQS